MAVRASELVHRVAVLNDLYIGMTIHFGMLIFFFSVFSCSTVDRIFPALVKLRVLAPDTVMQYGCLHHSLQGLA